MCASQGKGGKIKGSSFERKISKLFTQWWNDAGFEGTFDRVPASGGIYRKVERSDYIGDISCTPDVFSATIECKCTESWEYTELFSETIARKPKLIQKGKNIGKPNSPSGIGEYWWQSCEEGFRASKIPLLIFTKNYHKDLIIVPTNTTVGTLYLPQFSACGVIKQFKFEEYLPCIEHTVILQLNDFLNIVEPKMLRKD
jgi:hypothetical protein